MLNREQKLSLERVMKLPVVFLSIGLMLWWQLYPVASYALPSGHVSKGNATISYHGNDVNVNQHSKYGVVDWDNFNLRWNETANFDNDGGGDYWTLNRVHGGRSQVDGSIKGKSNHHLVFINENGIVFSGSSRIDTGSFIASSLGVSDTNFMTGKMDFVGNGNNAQVEVNGIINASKGIGIVSNKIKVGTRANLQAHSSTVVLASGKEVVVNFASDSLVGYAIKQSSESQVDMDISGTVTGSDVLIGSRSADNIKHNIINLSGEMRATKKISVKSNGSVKVNSKLTAKDVTVSAKHVMLGSNTNIRATRNAKIGMNEDGSYAATLGIAEGAMIYGSKLVSIGGQYIWEHTSLLGASTSNGGLISIRTANVYVNEGNFNDSFDILFYEGGRFSNVFSIDYHAIKTALEGSTSYSINPDGLVMFDTALDASSGKEGNTLYIGSNIDGTAPSNVTFVEFKKDFNIGASSLKVALKSSEQRLALTIGTITVGKLIMTTGTLYSEMNSTINFVGSVNVLDVENFRGITANTLTFKFSSDVNMGVDVDDSNFYSFSQVNFNANTNFDLNLGGSIIFTSVDEVNFNDEVQIVMNGDNNWISIEQNNGSLTIDRGLKIKEDTTAIIQFGSSLNVRSITTADDTASLHIVEVGSDFVDFNPEFIKNLHITGDLDELFLGAYIDKDKSSSSVVRLSGNYITDSGASLNGVKKVSVDDDTTYDFYFSDHVIFDASKFNLLISDANEYNLTLKADGNDADLSGINVKHLTGLSITTTNGAKVTFSDDNLFDAKTVDITADGGVFFEEDATLDFGKNSIVNFNSVTTFDKNTELKASSMAFSELNANAATEDKSMTLTFYGIPTITATVINNFNINNISEKFIINSDSGQIKLEGDLSANNLDIDHVTEGMSFGNSSNILSLLLESDVTIAGGVVDWSTSKITDGQDHNLSIVGDFTMDATGKSNISIISGVKKLIYSGTVIITGTENKIENPSGDLSLQDLVFDTDNSSIEIGYNINAGSTAFAVEGNININSKSGSVINLQLYFDTSGYVPLPAAGITSLATSINNGTLSLLEITGNNVSGFDLAGNLANLLTNIDKVKMNTSTHITGDITISPDIFSKGLLSNGIVVDKQNAYTLTVQGDVNLNSNYDFMKSGLKTIIIDGDLNFLSSTSALLVNFPLSITGNLSLSDNITGELGYNADIANGLSIGGNIVGNAHSILKIDLYSNNNLIQFSAIKPLLQKINGASLKEFKVEALRITSSGYQQASIALGGDYSTDVDFDNVSSVKINSDIYFSSNVILSNKLFENGIFNLGTQYKIVGNGHGVTVKSDVDLKADYLLNGQNISYLTIEGDLSLSASHTLEISDGKLTIAGNIVFNSDNIIATIGYNYDSGSFLHGSINVNAKSAAQLHIKLFSSSEIISFKANEISSFFPSIQGGSLQEVQVSAIRKNGKTGFLGISGNYANIPGIDNLSLTSSNGGVYFYDDVVITGNMLSKGFLQQNVRGNNKSLTVDGNVILQTDSNLSFIDSNLLNLTIDGDVTFNGTSSITINDSPLTITGNIVFGSDDTTVTLGYVEGKLSIGGINVGGHTSGKLLLNIYTDEDKVDFGIDVANTITVTGGTLDSLSIAGFSSKSNKELPVQLNGDYTTIWGTGNIISAVNISSDVIINGTVKLLSTLFPLANNFFGGKITGINKSELYLDGNITIDKDSKYDYFSTGIETLTIDGDLTFNGDAALSSGGALTITGTMIFANNSIEAELGYVVDGTNSLSLGGIQNDESNSFLTVNLYSTKDSSLLKVADINNLLAHVNGGEKFAHLSFTGRQLKEDNFAGYIESAIRLQDDYSNVFPDHLIKKVQFLDSDLVIDGSVKIGAFLFSAGRLLSSGKKISGIHDATLEVIGDVELQHNYDFSESNITSLKISGDLTFKNSMSLKMGVTSLEITGDLKLAEKINGEIDYDIDTPFVVGGNITGFNSSKLRLYLYSKSNIDVGVDNFTKIFNDSLLSSDASAISIEANARQYNSSKSSGYENGIFILSGDYTSINNSKNITLEGTALILKDVTIYGDTLGIRTIKSGFNNNLTIVFDSDAKFSHLNTNNLKSIVIDAIDEVNNITYQVTADGYFSLGNIDSLTINGNLVVDNANFSDVKAFIINGKTLISDSLTVSADTIDFKDDISGNTLSLTWKSDIIFSSNLLDKISSLEGLSLGVNGRNKFLFFGKKGEDTDYSEAFSKIGKRVSLSGNIKLLGNTTFSNVSFDSGIDADNFNLTLNYDEGTVIPRFQRLDKINILTIGIKGGGTGTLRLNDDYSINDAKFFNINADLEVLDDSSLSFFSNKKDAGIMKITGNISIASGKIFTLQSFNLDITGQITGDTLSIIFNKDYTFSTADFTYIDSLKNFKIGVAGAKTVLSIEPGTYDGTTGFMSKISGLVTFIGTTLLKGDASFKNVSFKTLNARNHLLTLIYDQDIVFEDDIGIINAETLTFDAGSYNITFNSDAKFRKNKNVIFVAGRAIINDDVTIETDGRLEFDVNSIEVNDSPILTAGEFDFTHIVGLINVNTNSITVNWANKDHTLSMTDLAKFSDVNNMTLGGVQYLLGTYDFSTITANNLSFSDRAFLKDDTTIILKDYSTVKFNGGLNSGLPVKNQGILMKNYHNLTIGDDTHINSLSFSENSYAGKVVVSEDLEDSYSRNQSKSINLYSLQVTKKLQLYGNLYVYGDISVGDALEVKGNNVEVISYRGSIQIAKFPTSTNDDYKLRILSTKAIIIEGKEYYKSEVIKNEGLTVSFIIGDLALLSDVDINDVIRATYSKDKNLFVWDFFVVNQILLGYKLRYIDYYLDDQLRDGDLVDYFLG